MTTIAMLPEQATRRVVLEGVSWDTYERLLGDFVDRHTAHFSYDQGKLEIMVLSARHEQLNRTLSLLVEVLAEELGIDVENLGSTTFKRSDMRRGFEPDSCFYILDPQSVRGRETIELGKDPAPDLVLEIDLSRPSLNKLPIYASLGVREVWRCDGTDVIFYGLRESQYETVRESAFFPGLSTRIARQFLAESRTQRRPQWLKRVRAWARQQGG